MSTSGRCGEGDEPSHGERIKYLSGLDEDEQSKLIIQAIIAGLFRQLQEVSDGNDIEKLHIKLDNLEHRLENIRQFQRALNNRKTRENRTRFMLNAGGLSSFSREKLLAPPVSDLLETEISGINNALLELEDGLRVISEYFPNAENSLLNARSYLRNPDEYEYVMQPMEEAEKYVADFEETVRHIEQIGQLLKTSTETILRKYKELFAYFKEEYCQKRSLTDRFTREPEVPVGNVWQNNLVLTSAYLAIEAALPNVGRKDSARTKSFSECTESDLEIDEFRLTQVARFFQAYSSLNFGELYGQPEKFHSLVWTLIKMGYDLSAAIESACAEKRLHEIRYDASATLLRRDRAENVVLKSTESNRVKSEKMTKEMSEHAIYRLRPLPPKADEDQKTKAWRQRQMTMFEKIHEAISDMVDLRARVVSRVQNSVDPKKAEADGSDFDEGQAAEARLEIARIVEEETIKIVRKLAIKKAELEEQAKGGKSFDRARNASPQRVEEGNFSYIVAESQGSIFGGGGLSLERIGTYGVGYVDIIGASWRKVEQRINTILEYTDRQHIHAQLSPRQRLKANFLLIGHYGTAKNEFVKAIISDERITGVSNTTDRVISKYLGEYEKNIRSLFELCEGKFYEHGKPVVLAWDEFDSVYGHGASNLGGTHEAAQKTLQATLEGDVTYNGVFLGAMTNEPQKIPVSIYRRFQDVFLIEALTDDERQELMKLFMTTFPLDESVNTSILWRHFKAKTKYASGEILMKISERIFEFYLKALHANLGNEAMTALNRELAEVSEGKRMEKERVKSFFADKAPTIMVTEDMFRQAMGTILDDEAIKGQIKQQENFYAGVHRLLNQAFGGVL